MKIVNMSVRNYRQFKNAGLNFDDGITVLSGANNSGKTSLITLIKNVFTKEKDVCRLHYGSWWNDQSKLEDAKRRYVEWETAPHFLRIVDEFD